VVDSIPQKQFGGNMKKLIFAACVALVAMLAMVGCPTGEDTKTETVLISFALGEVDSTPVTGTAPSSVRVTKGGSLSAAQLAPPSGAAAPQGYIFDKWTTSDGTEVTTATKFSSAATLTATWKTIPTVSITYDLNWPAEAVGTAPAGPAVRHVYEDVEIGTAAVAAPTGHMYPTDYAFEGWYNAATGGIKYTAESSFADNRTFYAHWILDKFTDISDADEALYLTNGAVALYAFEIPADKTLADYDRVSVSYKVTTAGLATWERVGTRHVRLYGVYLPTTGPIRSNNQEEPYNQAPVLNFDLSGNDSDGKTFNASYILDNTIGTLNGAVANFPADEWYTITYDTTGGTKAHGSFDASHKQSTATGTVYFGVGIGPQGKVVGQDRANTFFQLVKDVKLDNSTDPTVTAVPGTKPAATYAQFLANKDPMVFEWRGDPEDASFSNPDLPNEPDFSYDRGEPPVIASLTKVMLGAGANVFTYINGGNTNNQRGWVTFTEAGRANAQSATATSTVTLDDFQNAWYLVIESAKVTSGELNLVWMGDADGWNAKLAIGNEAAAKDGVTIIENSDGTYTIRFLLHEALGQPRRYFEENVDWAGLAFSYWGSGDTSNIEQLGITEAYLLVETSTGPATGISLGLTFSLGTAPAGGALIDYAELSPDGTNLIVKALPGKFDSNSCRWYVNGTAVTFDNNSWGGTLTTSVGTTKEFVVSLQALRGGKWVSQAVVITVKE
jgi:uncharacterized repeat protein (TIGR02543 family)